MKMKKHMLAAAVLAAALSPLASVAPAQPVAGIAYASPAAETQASDAFSVDFKTGCPALFEASDGWTNGNPFNVFWHKSNVTFEDGLMQLIIDNEIMGIAQRLRGGLDVNDETIDWDELIAGIDRDPAFSFLMSEHTFRHFEEPHRPDMFNRDGVVRWEREGRKTLLDKAEEKYFALMAEKPDYELPADRAAAVDEVLKKAHAALVKE